MKRVPSIFIIITFVIFSNVHLNSQIFLPAEYTDNYGVSYSGRVNINQLKNKESIKFYTEWKYIDRFLNLPILKR